MEVSFGPKRPLQQRSLQQRVSPSPMQGPPVLRPATERQNSEEEDEVPPPVVEEPSAGTSQGPPRETERSGNTKRRRPYRTRVQERKGDLGKVVSYILHSGETSSEESENEDQEVSSMSSASPSESADEVSENYDSDASLASFNSDRNGTSEIAEPTTLIDNQVQVNEILETEYVQKIVKKVLPPVSEKLAATLSLWLREPPKREKIKELFAELSELRPENVEGLDAVKINELLYQKLPFKAKVNDQRLRGMNTYLTRGIGPLIAILDNLIDFEASLISNENVQVSRLGDNKISILQSAISVTGMRRLLHRSIKILSIGNAVCLQKRKSALKPYLDRRYHKLTLPNNPVTSDLLGPHLEDKISESNRITEAARKIIPRSRSIRRGGNKWTNFRKNQFNQTNYSHARTQNFHSNSSFKQRTFGNNKYKRQNNWGNQNRRFKDFRGKRQNANPRKFQKNYTNQYQKGNFKQSTKRTFRKFNQ